MESCASQVENCEATPRITGIIPNGKNEIRSLQWNHFKFCYFQAGSCSIVHSKPMSFDKINAHSELILNGKYIGIYNCKLQTSKATGRVPVWFRIFISRGAHILFLTISRSTLGAYCKRCCMKSYFVQPVHQMAVTRCRIMCHLKPSRLLNVILRWFQIKK